MFYSVFHLSYCFSAYFYPAVLLGTLKFLVPGGCDFSVYCALLYNNIHSKKDVNFHE